MKHRIFTLVMAICLLIGTLPVSAINPYGFVTLTFVSDDNVDFSGIKVVIYQTTLDTSNTNYTVFHDEIYTTLEVPNSGVLYFSKPSAYCAVSVDLSTLPSGMGASRQIISFDPGEMEATVEILPIDVLETSIENGNILPHFFSRDGKSLNASYSMDITSDYSNMTWQEIDLMNTIDVAGTISIGAKKYSFSMPINFGKENILEKYEVLENHHVISNQAKVLGICLALADSSNKSLISTETISLIRTYQEKMDRILQNNNAEKMQNSVSTKRIDQDEKNITWAKSVQKACQTVMSTYASMTASEYVLYSNGPGNVVAIYYEKSCADATDAEIINRQMNEIYSYFTDSDSWGLREPTHPGIIADNLDPLPNSTKICVVITDDIGLGCVMFSESGIPYIKVNPNEILPYDDIARSVTILAHEFQHCIQYCYNLRESDDLWIKESCANLAAATYAEHITHYLPHRSEFLAGINGYFATSYRSLHLWFSSSRVYSILFPLYVYQNSSPYGEWAAIKKLYEASEDYRDSHTTYNTYEELNLGLSSINSTYSFRKTFEEFAVANLYPLKSYPTYSYSSWGNPLINSYEFGTYNTGSSIRILESTAMHYQQFANLPYEEIELAFTVIDGPTSSLTIWGIPSNVSNNYASSSEIASTKIRCTSAQTRIRYTRPNSSVSTYTFVVINTHYTTELDYTMAFVE